MILASAIFDDCLSFLDDDRSNRYDEAKDLVPALNNAILYMVALFNAAFEQKKISPESLRELTYTAILPVTGTTTKKADVTTLMSNLWTIVGIDPDPLITGSSPNELLSETRYKWAHRSTLEEWSAVQSDPFSAGTSIAIPSEFVRPSYLGPGHYGGDFAMYVMVRPGSVFTSDKLAVWYLKNPSIAASGTSQIEFPRSIHGMLVQKTLNYLSMQHSGAGGYKSASDTKYGTITDKEIQQLASLMLS